MNDDIVSRFLDREARGCSQNSASEFLISEDKVIGLLKKVDYSRFNSFGRFKLKSKRCRHRLIHIVGMCFDENLLYRAMYILHRRTKFELGLYQLGNGEVFAVKEGERIILMAPVTYVSPSTVTEFQDFVVRPRKEFFKKWETWQRILIGRKSIS